MNDDTDILDISCGATPEIVPVELPDNEIFIPPPASPAVPTDMPVSPMAGPVAIAPSDPSGATPYSGQTDNLPTGTPTGIQDNYLGAVRSVHYGDTDGLTRQGQEASASRAGLVYDTNNEPVVSAAPLPGAQPVPNSVSVLPFPPRHDQAGYHVAVDEPVLILTGRDGRNYFLNDELGFVGKVTAADTDNGVITVRRQTLSGNPDAGGFYGASLGDLQDADSNYVDYANVLVLGDAMPSVDSNVWVNKRGRYYFAETSSPLYFGTIEDANYKILRDADEDCFSVSAGGSDTVDVYAIDIPTGYEVYGQYGQSIIYGYSPADDKYVIVYGGSLRPTTESPVAEYMVRQYQIIDDLPVEVFDYVHAI